MVNAAIRQPIAALGAPQPAVWEQAVDGATTVRVQVMQLERSGGTGAAAPDLRSTVAPEDASAALHEPLGHRFWSLASGRRLRHVVYSLIGCPAVHAATYMLVRHTPDGASNVLAVRRTRSSAPSVNLARIRKMGARLGANEVHLCQTGKSDGERAAIAMELAHRLAR